MYTFYYPRVQYPVFILRATEGLLSDHDLLLPEDVIDRMMREIPTAERLDVNGTIHCG